MTAPRIALAATLAVVGATTSASADRGAEAQALFDKGIADLKAGDYEHACVELAGSLARSPDSGTKGALAECQTERGKIATAWQLWRDLADTAPTQDDRADARRRADSLEPRLPRYVIQIPAPSPAGLTVTIDDEPADLSLAATPLPIDPGSITVVARAPGRDDWRATLQATEAQTTTIVVPQLTVTAAATAPADTVTATTTAPIPAGPPVSAFVYEIGALGSVYDAPADFSNHPDASIGVEAALGYAFAHPAGGALAAVAIVDGDTVFDRIAFERGFAGAGLRLARGTNVFRFGAGVTLLTGASQTLVGYGFDASALFGITRRIGIVLDADLGVTGEVTGLMGTFSQLRLGAGLAYQAD